MTKRRLPLWLSLAWTESLANKAFTVSFVINLSLGLVGFLTIDTFKGSINHHLDNGSRAILGGDLVVSAQRDFTDEETQALTKVLPRGSNMRSETRLMSMVAAGTLSRLAEVRAIDNDFPFYGTPLLKLHGPLVPGEPRAVANAPLVWVAPEILTQLGVAVGAPLKIGGMDFTIADVVDHDPTAGSDGLALAPRVFIGQGFLNGSTLFAKGSRVFRSLYVQLPPAADADEVTTRLKDVITSKDIRVRSHRKATEDLNRALLYLNDYLGLVALVALFLAGVGGAYLFRSFLGRRSRDIAILLSLGMPLRDIQRIYIAQLALLGTVATLLTGLFSGLLLPILPAALGELLPPGIQPHLGLESLAAAFLLSTVGSLLFSWPLLTRLKELKPQTLFQEDGQRQTFEAKLSWRLALAWLPALLAYWLMAVAEARSLVVGSLFVAIFLVALAIFAGAGLALTRMLAKRPAGRFFALDMATLSLARHPAATITSFVAIGLGALLVNLVPQLRGLIRTELEEPEGGSRPSLFLFDIQPEQEDGLKHDLTASGVTLSFISPMIRARLIAINGDSVARTEAGDAKTREEDEERRALNRGYNLSYRTGVWTSEEIVEGRPLAQAYQGTGPAEMSLETRFASRLGLGVGAHLTFEIQGVEVEGVVVNLRRVRWTSFQPNFFVQFQPGVLEEAPKTLVAAVPRVSGTQKAALQTEIVTRYPNVSVIDVAQVIDRLLGVVGQMSLAVYLMAILTLIAGLAVLLAIARHQAQRRIPDVTLLKVLGTAFWRLRAMAALEFGILSLAASALGATVSVGAAFVLSWFVFDRLWAFDWRTPLVLGVSLGVVSTVLSLFVVSRSLKGRPAALLGAARFG